MQPNSVFCVWSDYFNFFSETQPQLMLTGPMGAFNNTANAYGTGLPPYHGYNM